MLCKHSYVFLRPADNPSDYSYFEASTAFYVRENQISISVFFVLYVLHVFLSRLEIAVFLHSTV